MKTYSGRLVVRLPQEVHRELAEEAFQEGRSINQLLVESVRLRQVLRRVDPWPGIAALWTRGRELDPEVVARDVAQAVREVRRQRQHRTS